MATDILLLQQMLIALGLGAFIGMERERAPDRKYAGLRTLSILCAGGPLAVLVADLSGSVLPIAIYHLLGATFSLIIVYIRMKLETEDIGLTTSSTVFLVTLIGVLVGYDRIFPAVAITLMTVLLLSKKDILHKYTNLLTPEELSDAVKLGILAFVLYPILPAGAIDPYGAIHLRDAMLFMIFILLIQFAGYVSVKWLGNRASFVGSAFLGGIASSLAVVTAMARYVQKDGLKQAAYAGGVAAVASSVTRNLVFAAAIAPAAALLIIGPFAAAAVVAVMFVLYHYRRTESLENIELDVGSPFSFREAFKFGVFFLAIVMTAELAQMYLTDVGLFATALLGGIASSSAVVASAATLLSSGTITPQQAAYMITLAVIGSLNSKLIYTELAGARTLTKRLLIPYLLMTGAMLLVFVL